MRLFWMIFKHDVNNTHLDRIIVRVFQESQQLFRSIIGIKSNKKSMKLFWSLPIFLTKCIQIKVEISEKRRKKVIKNQILFYELFVLFYLEDLESRSTMVSEDNLSGCSKNNFKASLWSKSINWTILSSIAPNKSCFL